jgi:hypothetical protein
MCMVVPLEHSGESFYHIVEKVDRGLLVKLG